MQPMTLPSNFRRLGFHYFPDADHYREQDLELWLPKLQSLGCSWLTLVAPAERAVPEYFIEGLIQAGIQPVLHLNLPIEPLRQEASYQLLLESYAHWGVKYLVLFDRPNLRASWQPSAWAQTDLVERFLDLFIPLAELTRKVGLCPVFPALQPGGDYWDIAFLQAALRGLERRGKMMLVDSMALGAHAWANNLPLDWGSGGPERWPTARPYATPKGAQDQRGFRIFDWYLTVTRAELGFTRPIILLKAGSRLGDHADPTQPAVDEIAHARRNLALARWVCGETKLDDPQLCLSSELEPVPAEVLACNFWLLSAAENSKDAAHAWYPTPEKSLPVGGLMHQWVNGWLGTSQPSDKDTGSDHPLNVQAIAQLGMNELQASSTLAGEQNKPKGAPVEGPHPIAHYLLLPSYEWGIDEWYLDMTRSFVKEHQPTLGFSISEARLAKRVTVVGGVQAFPDSIIETLHNAGCIVERMIADGTVLAT
ncbi:MAG: hypothetical protein P8Z00_10150 [Anaerolineales bacterium]